jgi:CubicO group peptidase (beta-lactamase class C family)
MTALAVMQLVEKGKIELDAPVIKYLPLFETSDKSQSQKITVRQLLNQSSGIGGNAGDNDYLNDRSTASNFIDRLKRIPLLTSPGSKFEYAEANYVILGEIIRNVTGSSYEAYMQDNVFTPLEMKHTYTSKAAAEKNGLSQGYRTVFGFPVKTTLPYPVQYTSASHIISSAEDMTNYLRLYLNDGTFNDSTLLSKDGATLLQKGSISTDPNPPGHTYAMGWFTNDEYRMHNGNLANYFSCMIITPENKTGIILLANTNNRLVTGEYAMTAVFELKDLLLGKSSPKGGFGFRQIYLYFNAIVLLLLIFLLLRWVLTFTRWRKKAMKSSGSPAVRICKAVVPDLVLGGVFAGILLYLLTSFGVSLSVAFLGQPDIVIAFVGFTLLSWLNAAARGIIALLFAKKN